MVDVLFGDANETAGALYYSDEHAEPAPVRVVLKQLEAPAGLGGADAIVAGLQIHVRRAEVAAQPTEEARFEITDSNLDGTSWRVRTSQRCELGLIWECDVDEIVQL